LSFVAHRAGWLHLAPPSRSHPVAAFFANAAMR
jgi:hypothetical protein